jgi:hypothetical protein
MSPKFSYVCRKVSAMFGKFYWLSGKFCRMFVDMSGKNFFLYVRKNFLGYLPPTRSPTILGRNVNVHCLIGGGGLITVWLNKSVH